MRKRNLIILVVAITFFSGFFTSWFFTYRDIVELTYRPSPDDREFADKINVFSMKSYRACDTNPSENFNLMNQVFSGVEYLGLINKKNGGYQVVEPAKLDGIESFGLTNSAEYSEFFYFTKKKYVVVSKLFKTLPSKTGKTEIITRKKLSKDGWVSSEVITILKQPNGTRVACRAYH